MSLNRGIRYGPSVRSGLLGLNSMKLPSAFLLASGLEGMLPSFSDRTSPFGVRFVVIGMPTGCIPDSHVRIPQPLGCLFLGELPPPPQQRVSGPSFGPVFGLEHLQRHGERGLLETKHLPERLLGQLPGLGRAETLPKLWQGCLALGSDQLTQRLWALNVRLAVLCEAAAREGAEKAAPKIALPRDTWFLNRWNHVVCWPATCFTRGLRMRASVPAIPV